MKRREALSALDVLALARELDAALKGAFVDKVHQLGPDDVLVKLNARGGAGRVNLVVLGGRRVHITKRPLDVPERPSTFAMAARKRLGNSTVEAVEQVRFDRILKVRFRKGEDRLELIAELLPDGAVAVVEGGTIAVVAKPKIFKERKVAPKQPYAGPPPGLDPRGLSAEGLAKACKAAGGDIARALSTRAGMGPGLAAEVLARAGLEAKAEAASLEGAAWGRLAQTFAAIVTEATESPQPVALVEAGALVDLAPVPQKRWGGSETRSFPSMSELLDAYFEGSQSAAAKAKASEDAKAPLPEQEEIARLERIRAQQRAIVDELEAEIAASQGAAEAVYTSYPQVEMFLRLAKPGGSAKQLSELVKRAGLEATAPEVVEGGRAVRVDLKAPDGKVHRIEIEVGASVNEVAQSYYRLSARAKERLKGALAAIGETEAALTEAGRKRARALRVEKALAKDAERTSGPLVPPQPRKREWFEKYRWFLSSEGNLVVAGRDAGTNDTVVKKYLRPHDRYAHADVHGAPSVVIKRKEGQDEVGEATLQEACAFAALMSRAWGSGAGEAASYWVLPEQVSKTPESGEALGRGAFIIRGKRNTVRHVALKAAIGGLTVKGERKAMCGPLEAVSLHCDAAFLVAPGTRKTTDVAKDLAAKIRVHPDEIARALPPGGVEVLGPLPPRAPLPTREEE